jgi:hypothetical protein
MYAGPSFSGIVEITGKRLDVLGVEMPIFEMEPESSTSLLAIRFYFLTRSFYRKELP